MPDSHEFPPKDWSWSTGAAPPLVTRPIPIYFNHSNIYIYWKQRNCICKEPVIGCKSSKGDFYIVEDEQFGAIQCHFNLFYQKTIIPKRIKYNPNTQNKNNSNPKTLAKTKSNPYNHELISKNQ